MEYVELRSDTFTKPNQEMREVIANADVGDDVFAEDPTINKLQEMVPIFWVKKRRYLCQAVL